MDDHFRIIDHPVSLRYPSATVAQAFRHILCGFSTPDNTHTLSPFDIQERQSHFRVTQNNILVGTYQNLPTLVTSLEFLLHQQALAHMSELGIHAGAVAKDNRVLMLPGHSGAGKTTLVLGLLLLGWSLFTDEMALIHTQTPNIRPFPRVLCIKHESLKLFRPLDHHNLLEHPESVLRLNDIDCISPIHFPIHPPTGFGPASWIIFSGYQAGTKPRLKEMAKAQALTRLLQHISNKGQLTQSGLRTLGNLIENTRCFELQAGPLRQTLDLIVEQWEALR
ncbi:MAG: hypothetical protein O7G87_04865 [bacterium]|nr:hypothetical protein [bacterium]